MILCKQDMKNGNAGGGGNNSQPKHDSNRELTTMSAFCSL